MSSTGTPYQTVPVDYFARRGLRRYAGVFSLWALGVGAVISGHYSGWNLGLLAGGWGGYALAALAIAAMYLGLVFCIAEMAAALPHTGGAYSFARASMGPWGGFITGLCENVEYVLTPAVVVSFLAVVVVVAFAADRESNRRHRRHQREPFHLGHRSLLFFDDPDADTSSTSTEFL